MDGIGLSLLVVLAGGVALLLLRRARRQLPTTHHSVRCPIHGTQVEVAVATDPTARPGRQYCAVTACSALPDAAFGLPDRVAYLWDGPPSQVRLGAARSFPLYTAEIPCRQPCVEGLNATALSRPSLPLRCTSGVSDGIPLAEQALGEGPMSRLLWYASL